MNETSAVPPPSTIDSVDVERFSRIAGEWWDTNGKFAPLHRLNPVRIGYIRDRAAAHWTRDALSGQPLNNLSVLDIGCGGGLLSEPMARLGATVTGYTLYGDLPDGMTWLGAGIIVAAGIYIAQRERRTGGA